MLGQAHTRRRLLPYAAIALLMLVLPAVGGARATHSTGTRAPALRVYALDHSLAAARARLATLVRSESSLQAQRASLVRQLSLARRSTRVAQAHLREQLRVMYEQNDVEPLEVLLGSRSLEEAMSNIDTLDNAATSNKAVLRQLTAAKTQLLAARQALAVRTAALGRARTQAVATVSTLAQARAARVAYIASLARQQRVRAVAQAHAAEQRVGRLQPGPQARSGATLTVSTTGYSLGGRTSSGLPVGAGVAAVDPSVIPLGTHMTIPGYGEAVAADTGSSIKGNRVDLWFPTLAKARAWGRRTVTITLH